MKSKRKVSIHFGSVRFIFVFFAVIYCALCASISSSVESISKDVSKKISQSKHCQFAEISCADCHLTGNTKPLTTEDCLACHGSFEEVAGETAKLDPNPHNSPHYGTELDCDLCHHEHSRSENFCAQCHEWKLIVP